MKHDVFVMTAYMSVVYIICTVMLTTGWLIQQLCLSLVYLMSLTFVFFLTRVDASIFSSIFSFAACVIIIGASTQYRLYDNEIKLFEIREVLERERDQFRQFMHVSSDGMLITSLK
jgi:energy-coupling factor transporter transmembrane protein EcfT